MANQHETTIRRIARSRRAIIKTGARLAYAAPVVAATTRLSGAVAGAQVVSGGGRSFTVFGISETPLDTGIDVTVGQQICVNASGLVHLCNGTQADGCPVGPEGDPGLGGACGTTFTCGVLLAVVNGVRFPLGASGCTTVPAPAAGRLSLVVHDLGGGYADNDGSYQVTVTV